MSRAFTPVALRLVSVKRCEERKFLLETAFVVSSVFLWLITLANVFLTLALIRRLNRTGQPVVETGLKAGTTAPDFTAQTVQGVTKTLADYLGQAVALIFVSPSCQPCRESLPMLQRTAAEARASGVEFVLVSGGTLEETQDWDEEVDMQLPLLIATQAQNPFFQDYQITSTPTFCLLASDGKVRGSNIVGQNFDSWKLLANTKAAVRL